MLLSPFLTPSLSRTLPLLPSRLPCPTRTRTRTRTRVPFCRTFPPKLLFLPRITSHLIHQLGPFIGIQSNQDLLETPARLRDALRN